MRTRRILKVKFLLSATSLVILGLAAFLVGRYAIAQDAAVVAQVDPSGTPVIVEKPPHRSIAAAKTAVAEDNQKTAFAGVLNGITFLGPGTPTPENADCENEELREVPASQASAAIRNSPLDFQVGSLPSSLRLTQERATTCDDDVVAVGRVYEGNDFRLLSIVRIQGAPVSAVMAPSDRLKPLTINGRPSVVVEPIGFSATVIIMRDEQGTVWTITADEIDADVAVEIAKGLT